MGNDASPSSVVLLVVTYNSERHIANLLQSVPRDSRVVVIDNASTDTTLEIASGFSAQLDLEILRLETNRGYAAGINAGMAHIGDSSDWVFVLNPDIILNLAASSPQLPAYSPYAIVQPRIVLPDGTVNVDELCMNVWGFGFPPEYAQPPQPKNPKQTFFFSGAAFLLNIEKYGKIGPFDESLFLYYEEVDYAFRIFLEQERILFDPSWTVTHAYELSTASRRKMGLLLRNRPIIMDRYATRLWKWLSVPAPFPQESSVKVDHASRRRILATLLPDLRLGFDTRQFSPLSRFLVNLVAVPLGLLIKTILKF